MIAPTNEAFAQLPKATVDKVTSDDALLKNVLTHHVLAGRVTLADIESQIAAGNGTAHLETLEGDEITAMMDGNKVELKGPGGGMADITIPNVFQSNGVIQVANGVLLPLGERGGVRRTGAPQSRVSLYAGDGRTVASKRTRYFG